MVFSLFLASLIWIKMIFAVLFSLISCCQRKRVRNRIAKMQEEDRNAVASPRNMEAHEIDFSSRTHEEERKQISSALSRIRRRY